MLKERENDGSTLEFYIHHIWFQKRYVLGWRTPQSKHCVPARVIELYVADEKKHR